MIPRIEVNLTFEDGSTEEFVREYTTEARARNAYEVYESREGVKSGWVKLEIHNPSGPCTPIAFREWGDPYV